MRSVSLGITRTSRSLPLHNNYYFLRQLSLSIEKMIAGTVISECFSQDKDELVFRFETHAGSRYIKASVLPDFSCLFFPSDFNRARKNSVDLFNAAVGRRVMGVRQFRNERSFAILLSDSFSVLFKMHGNRANVLLFENENPVELFRKNVEADRALQIYAMDRDIDWSYDAFENNLGNLPGIYFTFGKIVWSHLTSRGFETLSVEKKWEAIQQVIKALEDPPYYVTEIARKPVLSLLPTGSITREWNNPIDALNDFFYTRTQVYSLLQLRNSILSDLKSRLVSGTNYCIKSRDKLKELRQADRYREWADLLMANMHLIDSHAEKIVLENIYHENRPEEIPLKKDLPPQKNAAIYYRKSKNQQLEIDRLEDSLSQKENEINALKKIMTEAESVADFKSLKRIQADMQMAVMRKEQKVSLPYHEFTHDGFQIRVGKNAESNDILTTKMSHKDDLWLHAKDVAGSHVVIRHQSGRKFPKDVIERAAQLAAYNSKRKNDTLCPVIVTPRKFVRKRKGDPAGVVAVDREKIIMVEPKL